MAISIAMAVREIRLARKLRFVADVTQFIAA
jgi:hypothetical protein